MTFRDRIKLSYKLLMNRIDQLITLTTWLRTWMLGANPHKTDDVTNLITAAVAVDLATAQTLANDIKAKYNAHCGSTTHHLAADATNTTTAADATDQATLNTLVNEMKGDFNAHYVLLTSHYQKDNSMLVTAAGATDLATSLVLVNELRAKYILHSQWTAQVPAAPYGMDSSTV